jgi:hypothetical protein
MNGPDTRFSRTFVKRYGADFFSNVPGNPAE